MLLDSSLLPYLLDIDRYRWEAADKNFELTVTLLKIATITNFYAAGAGSLFLFMSFFLQASENLNQPPLGSFPLKFFSMKIKSILILR